MAEALRNHLILSFSEDRLRVGKGIWGRKAVLRPYPRSLRSEWEGKGVGEESIWQHIFLKAPSADVFIIAATI